jgi:hypothetical protein
MSAQFLNRPRQAFSILKNVRKSRARQSHANSSTIDGSYFWGNPQEELAVVFMAATPSESRAYFRTLVKNLVLASIVD